MPHLSGLDPEIGQTGQGHDPNPKYAPNLTKAANTKKGTK
jgi:hypothetical protein